jgi:hypothetical protein
MTPVSASMLTLTPGPAGSGAGASTDSLLRWNGDAQAFARAKTEGYWAWLDHVWPAAGCSSPVRLQGSITTVDASTGHVLGMRTTDDMPDGVIYKACGNRRAEICPSCAETYRRDAYQLIRAGIVGGKTIDESVATHPAVFGTFTAPSFGHVHTRVVRTHTCLDKRRCNCRAEPCRARRHVEHCPHGVKLACFRRHGPNDELTGKPLCADCYDYAGHVVWNLHAGELWRRTAQAIQRAVTRAAKTRGIPFHYRVTASGRVQKVSPVRVRYAKVAEYQARGVVHYHAIVRLDGYDPDRPDDILPCPPGMAGLLEDAITDAAAGREFTTDSHPYRPEGWSIGWGAQLDVRTVKLAGDGSITDTMVAAYLAKYSTKSTEATGHVSHRLTRDRRSRLRPEHTDRPGVDDCDCDGACEHYTREPAGRYAITLYANPEGSHTERLIAMCWSLSQHPEWVALERWAHMLGFGGHFLTKARRYSVTFAYLRGLRITWRRDQQPAAPDSDPQVRAVDHDGDETTLIIGAFSYAGSGWRTTGDAMLANTAAALAREREQVGREEAAQRVA